ncbi:monocarboxylate transporter 14-like [Tubulanus polymorphus]|uniref:monocarboxylate transporter 14-like n=1 Tax=Tubulanus polymorphus TaxID=672921 RepID=UPI003DA3AB44
MFVLQSSIVHAAISTIYVHIVSGSEVLLEISREQARFTLSAIAIANLIGRVIVSLTTKHPRIDTFTLYLILNTLLGVEVCLIPNLNGYTAAVAICAAIGFSLSALGCLHALVLMDLFGSDYLFMSYAYSMFFGGIGFLFGAPMAGWIYDRTVDYAVSFYYCAVLVFISVLLVLPGCVCHYQAISRRESEYNPGSSSTFVT